MSNSVALKVVPLLRMSRLNLLIFVFPMLSRTFIQVLWLLFFIAWYGFKNPNIFIYLKTCEKSYLIIFRFNLTSIQSFKPASFSDLVNYTVLVF